MAFAFVSHERGISSVKWLQSGFEELLSYRVFSKHVFVCVNCIRVHVKVCTTHTHIHTHARTHARTHAHTHTHTHTHENTHTHTREHTHTFIFTLAVGVAEKIRRAHV